MYNNVKKGGFYEGASTISQQLIKNTHLSSEKTIKRKLLEMALTKKLEKEFSKKDILETYLNVIYFGEGAYGLAEASKVYFSKQPQDLNLQETALLAGIIKSPAKYSPIYEPDNALKRRNLVLKLMLENSKITPSQFEEAINSDIELNLNETKNNFQSLYAKATLLEASQILNLSEKDVASSGVKIYTFLNQEAQENLQNIMQNTENYHKNSFGNINDSLGIVIDNENYGIIAFAGKSQYNLTNFKRQPGSVIKPMLVYAPALEKGVISPLTQILDEPINYNGYSPNNVGKTFHGYVSVTQAISQSLNIPAVKVLDYIRIDYAKNYAKNLGINFDKEDTGLAIALGGLTVGNTLKEITNAYVPFSNGGYYKPASFIKKIESLDGKVLYEHTNFAKQVVNEDVAYLMTNMLIDGVKNGTSKKLSSLPYEVAGKTGTIALKNTNYNTDAYSIAYTTKHTMGVWIGNYSNNEEYVMESVNNGGTYATGIIQKFFPKLYSNEKPNNFNKPENVIELDIDAKALSEEHVIKLADENCPERYRIKGLFSKRYIPKEYSDTFSNLNLENFNVEYANHSAKISFEAKDYFKYEVIKKHKFKEDVIRVVDNFSGAYEFYDNNLDYETTYSYYIKVINPHSNVYNLSDSIIIVTNAKEKSLNHLIEKLSDNKITPEQKSNLSWFFT